MARLVPLTLLLSAAALPVAAQSPAPSPGTYEEWATPSDFQEAPPPAPPAVPPAPPAPDATRATADQAAAEQVRAARAEALAAEQAARIARQRAEAALQALQIAERDARSAKQAVEVTEERIRAEQQLRAAEEQARAAEQVRLAEQRRQAEAARLQAQALREEQLRQAEHARMTEQARKEAEREVQWARFQQEQAEAEARRHAAQAEAEFEAEAAEQAYDQQDEDLQHFDRQHYGQVAQVNEVHREVAETPFLSLTADGAIHDRHADFGLYNLGLRFEGERGGLLATLGGISTSSDDWSYFTIEPTFAVVATRNFRWRLRAGWSSAFTRNVAMSGFSGGGSMVIHVGGPVDLELDAHMTMVPFFRFDTTAAWALNFGGLSVRAGWRAAYLNDLGNSSSVRVSHAGYFGPFLGLGLHI